MMIPRSCIVKTSVAVFLCMFAPSTGQSWDQKNYLMTNMLNSYNKKLVPVADQSRPIYVNVTFDMIFIQELDEVTGKFSYFGFFSLSWIDEKIRWNPYYYGGTWSLLFNAKDIWYPVLVASSSFDKVDDVVEDWMTIRTFYYGLSVFTPGVVFKTLCSIDVTYYPFDTQECQSTFVPWGYFNTELRLLCPSEYAKSTYYLEGGEWEIIENSTYADEYNSVFIKFKLRRKPLFAIVNTILPIVIMSALNMLVFVLPVESGERVSYSITVLLSIAVFLTLVADTLPKTSEPMSVLAYFLMVSLANSSLICVCTILNLRLFFKKDTHPIPVWLEFVARCISCICSCSMKKLKTNKNTVVPIEINVDMATKRGNKAQDSLPKVIESDEIIIEEITWQDVSAAIDKVLLVFFILASVVSTGVFVAVLAKNKGAVG